SVQCEGSESQKRGRKPLAWHEVGEAHAREKPANGDGFLCRRWSGVHGRAEGRLAMALGR
ncbi:MAG: hypothetical protein ACRD3T_02870, partial [Terriglobia bacterium]